MNTTQRQKRPTLRRLREANRSAHQVAHQAGADHCFAGVADEPAQNHQRRNVTLQLCRQMRGKRGQQHEPPAARRRQQKRCDQDRIRRPKNRDRMRLKRECETDFAPKIISSEHPQPDHQQMPVKNGAKTVRVPRCRLNVRGFKRDGSALHLQRTSRLANVDFEGNALSRNGRKILFGRASAENSPDVTVAIAVPITTRMHAIRCQLLSTAPRIIAWPRR